MPLYEYQCPKCGTFTAWARMSESSAPALCSECGCKGPRMISAPRLALMKPATRRAMARNEQSAHEPGMVQRSSCGCSGSHACGRNKVSSAGHGGKKSILPVQPKSNARPWMLGH
ncbi:MAG: zinc ribbon domain-containing protein [Gammaproteobacteria bacterium]|nr:MAG: zinc ribbon domain-containing protein [Gammaproteobacteria bacterium]